jgi:hypothetical protein
MPDDYSYDPREDGFWTEGWFCMNCGRLYKSDCTKCGGSGIIGGKMMPDHKLCNCCGCNREGLGIGKPPPLETE